jgi:hypothetical protein
VADRKKATPRKPRKGATRKNPVPRHVTSQVRVANQLNVTSPITTSQGESLEVYQDDQTTGATGIPPTTHHIFRDGGVPVGWMVRHSEQCASANS